MASSWPPSTNQPAARGHQTVAFGLALTLLTFNSGLATYLSRDDMESVSSVAVSYLVLVLLFAWRLGCCESRGRRRLLKAAVWVLTLLLALLLTYKLLLVAPPSMTVVLVSVAGATALGLGGCCAFWLHRDAWSKQPLQEVISPLVLEVPDIRTMK